VEVKDPSQAQDDRRGAGLEFPWILPHGRG